MSVGLWQSVHIDDLRRSKDMISDMSVLQNLTISQMLCDDSGKVRGELCQTVVSDARGGKMRRCLPRLGAGRSYAECNVLISTAKHLM